MKPYMKTFSVHFTLNSTCLNLNHLPVITQTASKWYCILKLTQFVEHKENNTLEILES